MPRFRGRNQGNGNCTGQGRGLGKGQGRGQGLCRSSTINLKKSTSNDPTKADQCPQDGKGQGGAPRRQDCTPQDIQK